MKNMLRICGIVTICLILSVEPTDSNTAVDLRSLAKLMCLKNKKHKNQKVRFSLKQERFCQLSAILICPGVTKSSGNFKCVKSKSLRLNYQTIKVTRAVCEYEGRDEMVKKVKEAMADHKLCDHHWY